MTCWVVIPVKPLNRAKSRLAEVLTSEQRQTLAEALFQHVLGIALSQRRVLGTLVVSRDTRALALAREAGANTMQETGSPQLNIALQRATQVLIGWGAEAMLILPADLPFVAAEDLEGIVQLGSEGEARIVIATDKKHDGTNALYCRPPGIINFAYGTGSYERHIQRANEAGTSVQFYSSDRLQHDVDNPEDLRRAHDLVQSEVFPTTIPLGLLAIGETGEGYHD